MNTIGVVDFYPNAIVLNNFAGFREPGKIVGATVIEVDVVMSSITERFGL